MEAVHDAWLVHVKNLQRIEHFAKRISYAQSQYNMFTHYADEWSKKLDEELAAFDQAQCDANESEKVVMSFYESLID